MADAFISYARKDKDFIYKLQDAFTTRNRTAWVDLEDLYAGEEFWQRICTAIEEAHAFLFVMSPDSIASPYCRREIEHAVTHNKRIIPILYRESDEKSLPPAIAIRQWHFFRANDDFSTGFSLLLEALDVDPLWVHTHTRLLVRAIDWETHEHDSSFLLRGKDLNNAEQWLSHAVQKDPQPTPLHTQYIIESRHETAKRRGKVLVGVALSLAVSIVLGVMTWYQRDNARAQATIALARQLVLQAAPMKDRPDLSAVRNLLAVEAVRRFSSLQLPSLEAEELLRPPTPVLACATPKVGTTAVAFSPDGQFAATAGYACTVRIWDLTTGQQRLQIPHDTGIAMMTFSPDGRYLATLDWNSIPHVWTLEADKPPQDIYPTPYDTGVTTIRFSPTGYYFATANVDGTISVREFRDNRQILRQVHAGGATTVAFSPDGQYLATGGWDMTARIWEITTNHEVARFSHPETTKGVTRVEFSPDGQILATTSYDPVVRLWDVATGQQTAAIRHRSAVTAVAFSDDGQYIATAGWDKVVRLWQRTKAHEIVHLPHTDGVTTLQFTKDSHHLITGSYDREARVWSIPEGKEVAHLLHDSGVTSLAVSPDDQAVLSASYGPNVHLWNLDTGSPLRAPLTHTPYRGAIALSTDERHLATADNAGNIQVWSRTQNQPLVTFPYTRDIALLAVNPDGTLVAATDWDGSIVVWKVSPCLSFNCRPVAHMVHEGGVAVMTFDPSGKYLLTAGWDKTTRAWEARNPQHYTLIPHKDGVAAITFSADGTQLATAGWDETIRIWDTSTVKERAFLLHEEGAAAIAFSPDGKYLASAGWDNTLRIWDIAKRQIVTSLLHEETVIALAFSPDGKHLATAGSDKTAREWELPEFREVIRLPHDAGVMTIGFSPNGEHLTTVNWQYVALQWIRQQGKDLVHTTCLNLKNRRLTPEEWEKYVGIEEPYRETCQDVAAPEGRNT
ncbi:MAG: TIR domain-containing protein [Candidatus Binatia bacterium]